jgi:hypothetical protein
MTARGVRRRVLVAGIPAVVGLVDEPALRPAE